MNFDLREEAPETQGTEQVFSAPEECKILTGTKKGSLYKRRNEMQILAQHSSKSAEHYTPNTTEWPIVTKVHQLMGGIDLDPASCNLAQSVVQAKRYYKLPQDGLALPWEGSVFLNPPGGDTAKVRPELVSMGRSYPLIWWQRLLALYRTGEVCTAVFVAFQMNLWANGQNHGMHDFSCCVLKDRVKFDYPEDTENGYPLKDSDRVPGGQPPGYSVLVYLPPKDSVESNTARFVDLFSEIGRVWC